MFVPLPRKNYSFYLGETCLLGMSEQHTDYFLSTCGKEFSRDAYKTTGVSKFYIWRQSRMKSNTKYLDISMLDFFLSPLNDENSSYDVRNRPTDSIIRLDYRIVSSSTSPLRVTHCKLLVGRQFVWAHKSVWKWMAVRTWQRPGVWPVYEEFNDLSLSLSAKFLWQL